MSERIISGDRMSTPQDCVRVALGLEVDGCQEARVVAWHEWVDVYMRWRDGPGGISIRWRMTRSEWLRLIREALAKEVAK
jgi:hypothetical protein